MKIKIAEIVGFESKRKHGNIKELASSIKKEGLLQPLVINQNNELICGRRRYEALCLLKWEKAPVIKIETESDADKLSKAITENIMRKNLEWQEEIKAKEQLDQLMRMEHGEPKPGRRTDIKPSSNSEEGWSITKTATKLNESEGLTTEDIQLSKALKKYPEIGKCKNKSQAKRKLRSIKKDKMKSKIPELPDQTKRYKFIHGDLIEVSNQIKNNSLDWIITDPPYPKEYLPLIDKLGDFSKQKLKLGGSLICMIGQSYLPEIYSMLSKYLIYNWTCAYIMPGDAVSVWSRRTTTGWKPLLWFINGEYKKDMIYDVFKSDQKGKEYHYWGQSESGMMNIIKQFTYPGDLICDPFLGGGTTGIVAIRMNRLFIGIDNDINAINITKKRMQDDINDKT